MIMKYGNKRLKAIKNTKLPIQQDEHGKHFVEFAGQYHQGMKAKSFNLFKRSKIADFNVTCGGTDDKALHRVYLKDVKDDDVIEIEGIGFDSKKEFKYYDELHLDPDVIKIEMRPVFDLTSPNSKNKVKYVGDFKAIMRDGRVRIIDVKGFKTYAYKLKAKLVKDQYGIDIEEVY